MFHNQDGTPDNVFTEKIQMDLYNIFKQVFAEDRLIDVDRCQWYNEKSSEIL